MPEIRDTGQAAVVVTQSRNTVAVTQQVANVVRASSPGVQGPAGQNGADGGTYTTKTASVALGGHRIVRSVSATHVDYASAAEPLHGDDTLGLTVGAAIAGAAVQVANEQDVTEPSWNWVPEERLFLGLDGLLTQTPPEPPVAAFIQCVGFATSATSARIRIEPPDYY